MATQGIVSIVSGGETVIKVIAGSDGMNAGKLATIIRERNLSSLEEIYDAALECSFGHARNLVVMDKESALYKGDDDPLDERYRRTFNDPNFNPRWKHGTADHVEIIER